ncbi:hypothetical protein V6V47_22560 [Micromonospora sp. CPCC 205539]|uniref:hypothetical protein n=1 Tax=Micromonospora sp. CPCC 205539 TaxID=3122408 RepID=UPI002FF3933B
MKLLRTLAISGAATLALVFGATAPASADTYSYNDYGTADYRSNGDYVIVTHWDEYPGGWSSYAEWYTSYGRTGTCGETDYILTCNEDVAENRYITIRICTRVGSLGNTVCGDWATSRT